MRLWPRLTSRVYCMWFNSCYCTPAPTGGSGSLELTVQGWTLNSAPGNVFLLTSSRWLEAKKSRQFKPRRSRYSDDAAVLASHGWAPTICSRRVRHIALNHNRPGAYSLSRHLPDFGSTYFMPNTGWGSRGKCLTTQKGVILPKLGCIVPGYPAKPWPSPPDTVQVSKAPSACPIPCSALSSRYHVDKMLM